ncbi:ankyrin repeat-containing protein NPR4-like [Daucus carota subsp. sativus]|uniref:ankyrin repeat-containing protein NPR4-like n=1 Tax=Daucus carota subsp. sativus TaxID=79200 RepID=UPI0007EF85F5|nr:PREDICTED: uncharacterized protein LOC108212929 [Daucus carota subsp. sativus]
MNIEVLEEKLYAACLKGDVEKLEALMREDELTLARVSVSSCFNQTSLHLASMLGHFEFAKSLLSYMPAFGSRLDSQGRSPLHLASANGYADIVKLLLLEHDQKICSVPDEDGRTPLHLAVMNGQYESVSELIKVESNLVDQELGKVLHLCVTYNRLSILILILESTSQDLSNIKDDNGNTILQLATSLRRTQMVKFLVKSRSGVDVNVVDENGLTALDIIEQMPKDVKSIEIKELLTSAGTLRAKEIQEASCRTPRGSPLNLGVGGQVVNVAEAATGSNSKPGKLWNMVKKFTIFQEKKEKRDEPLLVAASVMAAMAYQAAINPPGGVAAMDAAEISDPSSTLSKKIYDLKPGHSLLAYFEPGRSDGFWVYNTISFVAALSVIFLFVSGANLKRKLYVWLIRAAVWLTLSSMTFAYVIAVQATSVEADSPTIIALIMGLYIWIGMIAVSFLVVLYRSASYMVRKIYKNISKLKKITAEDTANSTNCTNV